MLASAFDCHICPAHRLHAIDKFDHPNGKKKGLCDHGSYGQFKYIPNELPGLETRVPLLFTYGVLNGKITPQKFVELTSMNPAKLYGLKRKGTIAPGYDADITIWYPQEHFEPFELSNGMLHHVIDYTPYEGFEFDNWPRHTLLRGKLMFSEGKLVGSTGTENLCAVSNRHSDPQSPSSPADN